MEAYLFGIGDKMKQLGIMLVVFLFFLPLVAQTAVVPTEGDGSSANPYRIASLENLCWVAQNPVIWSSNFLQTADIDASETATWYPNGSGGYYGWTPIGIDGGVHFTGLYHGNGYAIKGLYINRPTQNFVGLFGKVRLVGGVNGQLILRNIKLVDADITGYDYVGSLAGEVRGWNDYSVLYRPHVYNCHSIANVTGNSCVGGLIAQVARSYLTFSSSSGIVNGTYYLGGLVGSLYDSTEISKSYSTARVGFANRTGGLVGHMGDNARLYYCYSSGQIGGGGFSGGLVGHISDVDFTCSADNCFWDMDSSGTTTSRLGTGKTSAQMKTRSTYPASVWLFEGDVVEWWMLEGNTRPILRTEYSTRIRTPHQLQMMKIDPSADYQIIWDIDLSAIQNPAEMWATNTNATGGFVPIGNLDAPFTGTLDGNEFVLSDLYIKRGSTDHQSLFGYCNGAVISDLDIVDAYVMGQTFTGGLASEMINGCSISNCGYSGITHGTSPHTGGVVGYLNGGTLLYCFSSGVVNGSSWIGGLAGMTLNGATVSNCYSRAEVNGNSRVGGLIGNSANDTVTNCYSTGCVTGGIYTGGLIGEKSYGITSNCFWDIWTSFQDYSSGTGALGVTTTQMTTQSTFTDAGWNFSTVWAMQNDVNDGYPYLIWGQIIAAPSAPSNVVIVRSGDEVLITWDEVIGATSYKVYSCSDPNGEFIEDLNGSFNENSWTGPATDTRLFYHVRTALE